MGQFTQEEQVEIVKNARDLQATIEYEEREVTKFKGETFKAMPQPPKRAMAAIPEKVQPEYPEKPKATYSFWDYLKDKYALENKKNLIVAIIVTLFLGLITIILVLFSYLEYPEKVNEKNLELEKTEPEYLKLVAEAERVAKEKQDVIDAEVKKQQEKLDEEHKEKQKHYDEVVLPQYKNELNIWRENQSTKIAVLEEEIRLNKEALAELYDTSKLISATYRQLWILEWLHEDMSTSDHDIRYATELLDRDRQRKATEYGAANTIKAIGRMEQTMKTGFNAVYNAVEYGNALQEDTIDELSRVRRSIRNGNIVGAVQRHNTNKMLKSLVK